jgi:hypothetical protein
MLLLYWKNILSHSDIRGTGNAKFLNGIDNIILHIFMFERAVRRQTGCFLFHNFHRLCGVSLNLQRDSKR